MAPEAPFREIVSYAIGGGWGSDSPIDGTAPVSIIRGTDFADLRSGNTQDVPRRYEGKDKVEKRMLRPDDVVLEISGGSPISGQSTGRTLLLKESMLADLGGKVIPASFCRLVRFDRAKVDPRYAYYSLQDMYLSGRAAEYEHRSTGISNFQFEYFLDHEMIRLVPLREQRAIANLLGALDDKIDLNRRMNQTVEAMARALFNSWFVNVDPVHAKAEGRDTGLPQPIAGLFPDRFEDGEVPAGWKVQSFADTVEIIGGGTPKTTVAEYWNGEIPWFSVVDAPNESDVWVVETQKKITSEGVDNSSTRILPVGTTIVSARGTVGRIALVGVPMAMNQSCYGLGGKSGYEGAFTYFATRQLVLTLRQLAHGSVFDTITRDTLAGVSVATPPSTLVKAFECRAGPLLDRARVSLLESRTLASLRDALLPKLISGEVRVPQAQGVLEAVPT